MFIMGVQCAIFERESIQLTAWNGAIAGYLVGYTLSLFILYSLAPVLFRMSSAMFYNLSLLTSGIPSGEILMRFLGFDYRNQIIWVLRLQIVSSRLLYDDCWSVLY
jgi:hypothetical protein